MNIAVNALEIAARNVRAGKSPIDRIDSMLLSIGFVAYRAFRTIAAFELSYLDSPAADEITRTAPGLRDTVRDQFEKDLKELTAAKMREYMRVKPGNGKTPITISYYYDVSTSPEVVFAITKKLPKRALVVDTMRESGNDFFTEMLKEYGEDADNPRQVAYYADICKLYINRIKVDEETLRYKLDIEIDSMLYPKIIDSDTFSPYLVYVWANNAMSMRYNRVARIIDPRTSSTLTNSILAKYGNANNPKPRVNSNGFAIYKNGMPILLPKQADSTKQLVDAGDAAIDEDGEFDIETLIEKTPNLANAIIYIDWLNDVLVYTTSRVTAEVISLEGTSALDPSTEHLFLQTAIADDIITDFFNVVDGMSTEVDMSAVKQYVPREIPFLLDSQSAGQIRLKLISASGTRGRGSNVTLGHIAGANPKDFEEYPELLALLANYRAYIKYIYEARRAKKLEIKLSGNDLAHSVRFRLIGFEYVLWAIANHTPDSLEQLRKAYMAESAKHSSRPMKTFDIPNLSVGEGGLTGFLPHQGKVLSSTTQTPAKMILPIQTGGGKTIVAAVTAIAAIDNMPGLRPLVTTKGSLVKGFISEVNQISKGKINVVPLRPWNLRRMKRMAGIKTFDDLMKWVGRLPRNTIFVNAYTDYASRSKIYPELPSVKGMLQTGFLDSQYLRIIRLLAIGMIIGDESHVIKNADSNRSRGACAAFGAADIRAIMSGTIVSNTVKDLVGQAKAISPVMFGESAEAFGERYGVSTGLIDNDETAALIRDRMTSLAAVHYATKDQWSYMLPAKDDIIRFCKLTPKQEEFYNKLLREAMLELEGKAGKKPTSEGSDAADGEDDDDDDEEKDEDEDDEEADENAFIERAKTSLASVEQFLVAPDENEQYTSQLDAPTGADLVSSKVLEADTIITQHLNANKGNLAKNKIVVFGVNLSAIRHFMRHSIHAPKALVYYAGDQEVLRQFVNDPTKTILVAAETSVREGENWQMCSLIVRLQSVWAPGDHEQAIARMYRPDPRGRYNRDWVQHVWVLSERGNGNPSLDGVKMARLSSKFISNARLTYEGTDAWRRVSREFDDLEMLKMNLELIFDSTKDTLRSYFGAWNTFIGWENELNDASRMQKARELEQATGEDLIDDKTGKIRDINRFVALAMVNVESTRLIPGSKRVYTPWAPGALPADPDNLGFQTLGQQPIKPGDVVYTEFGPAIVRSLNTRSSLKVELYGGRIVGVRRLCACIVPPANYHKLTAIVADPAKWRAASFDAFDALPPAGKSTPKNVKPTPPQLDEDQVDGDEGEDQDDDSEPFDVKTAIVNGMPTLVLQEDEVPEGVQRIGWRRVDPYLSIRFRTWDGATNLINQMDSKVSIPEKTYNALMEEIEELKTGKAMRLTTRIPQGAIRDFFMDQRKKLGKTKDGKYIVKPYFLAIDTDIRLALDIDSHDPKVIQWLLRRAANVTGVIKAERKPSFWINMFDDVKEARSHIIKLAKVMDFDQRTLNRELDELRDEIRELQMPRRRPLK